MTQAPSFFIRTSSFLQVTRITINSLNELEFRPDHITYYGVADLDGINIYG